MATEISDKTMLKIPIPLAIVVCGGMLSVGSVYFKVEDGLSRIDVLEQKIEALKIEDEKRVEKVEKELSGFFQAEIDGLRSDWERRYRDNIHRRLEKLEK